MLQLEGLDSFAYYYNLQKLNILYYVTRIISVEKKLRTRLVF